MTAEDPDNGDDVLARLRAARPELAAPDLGDRACMARLERLKGAATEVAAGGYVIEQCVGEGAYGTVYRARHPRVEKLVALKHLRRDVAQQIGSAARSIREANSLGKLNHPNVVQVFDVVEDGDDTYIAMEYVDGESLVRWQQERRPWQEVLSVYLQAGDGLAAAHAAGLQHLDLKPANVLVGRDGRVRVVDFGLAREVSGPGSATDDKADETLVEHIPARGTIPYSSPEQRRGDDVDARSDQYSFCVALYEALHGVLPFTASELAKMRYVGFERPLRGARGRIPRRIDVVLRRGLADTPSERWPQMCALLAALRRPTWFQRPLVWVLAGGALVAGPVAAVYPVQPEACAAEDWQLTGAWDGDVRARVSSTFAASSAPFADGAWRNASARLDGYAERWKAQIESACTAKIDDIDYDATRDRLVCLRRARDQLARVTSLLADGEPDVLERADDLIRELTSPQLCSRPSRPAGERATAEKMETLAHVDRARLWLAAGRLKESREAAERAVGFANASQSTDARAEAHLIRGELFADLGFAAQGIDDLEQAVLSAIQAERDDVAARAWLKLTRIAVNDLHDAERALGWFRLAEATVARLGRPALAQADLLDTHGRYNSLIGNEPAAEAAHRAALVELEKVLAKDDPRWTETWMDLAGVRVRRGDPRDAEAFDQRTLELREQRLGPMHPAVAKVLVNLAILARDRGEISVALSQVERAVSILERNYGEASLRLAPALTLQAQLLVSDGRLTSAEAAASRAWALQRAHLPFDHVDRREGALGLLLEISNARSDFERSLELLSVARSEAVARADEQALAVVDNNVAWTLCQLHRHREAEPIYTRLRDSQDVDVVLQAYAMAGLGAVALANKRPRAAVSNLEAALLRIRSSSPGDAAAIAEFSWQLAEALLRDKRGHSARAHRLATTALIYYEAHGRAPEVAAIRRLVLTASATTNHHKRHEPK